MVPNYAVSFLFCRTNVRLDFMFGSFKNADELFRKALLQCGQPQSLDIEDDFESRARVSMAEVAAVIFNNLDMERKNQIELRVSVDRAYSKAVASENHRPNIAVPANVLRV